MLYGIGASPGIGIGKVVRIKQLDMQYSETVDGTIENELLRYKAAAQEFMDQTEKNAIHIEQTIGAKEAEILRGHAVMLSDPYMNGEIENRISDSKSAESAVASVCEMFETMFMGTDDDLMKQRAADVRDIKNGLLKLLLGIEDVDIANVPKGTVLSAYEFTPSMTAGIKKENISAIVTETGGTTSHSAILARALGIPAVLSVADLDLCDGDMVIVDGTEGTIINNPSNEQIEKYTNMRTAFLKEKEALRALIGEQTKTNDGQVVGLCANIGNVNDAKLAMDNDAEGVGLFRTEFLYMDSDRPPTEEEQFEAYKKVALTMKGKPVVIRTLDIGGDKDISYFNIEKEENPFLGFRAIRYCMKNKDIYRTQLRALVRASAYGDIRIMVPMVVSALELRFVRQEVDRIKSDLKQSGIEHNADIKIGIMIETPAAVFSADILAKEADFFSIGTNDLTQYILAVDRGNAQVAYLYSHFDPSVIRAIAHTITCAKTAGIPVGMCGEAAADPLLIPVLIGFGLDEFSVSPTSVLATRNTISKWDTDSAKLLTKEIEGLNTSEDVVAYLKKAQR